MKAPTPPPPSGPKGITYCKSHINRWGQLMVAAHYGYKYWRFSK